MRVLWKLALTLGLVPLLMGAAVYRWVDENGVVNYTQQKPDGVAVEEVSAATGTRRSSPASAAPAAGAAASGPKLTSVSAEGDKPLSDAQQQMLQDLRQAEENRQAEIAKVKKANCEQARNVLANLTSRGRIRVADENGQYRVMPEEERQERIEAAQRSVALNCSDTASR